MAEVFTLALIFTCFSFQFGGVHPTGGLAKNREEASTTTPWIIPDDECVLVARDFQHFGNRSDCGRSAYAESSGGQADAQTAMVREPFQRVPNGAPIDDTGADTAHSVPKVEATYRLGPARSDPAQSDHD